MATDAVLEYYDGPDLERVVFGALEGAGRDVERLDPDDLAGLDEFHALGRPATLALAELAGIAAGERVLDLGAGIGGPSRVLARHYGAQVTALDPTDRFCRLNAAITQRSGLGDRVTVVRGDGREIPAADDSFDVVWTQAVLQSVDDKAALAREVVRVLVPGGRWALFEVIAAGGGEVVPPVPWADSIEQSFVLPEAELRALLAGAGFVETAWRTLPEVQESIVAAAAAPGMATGLDDVTLALVMPDFGERMAGLARNVEDSRIAVAQGVVTSG